MARKVQPEADLLTIAFRVADPLLKKARPLLDKLEEPEREQLIELLGDAVKAAVDAVRSDAHREGHRCRTAMCDNR